MAAAIRASGIASACCRWLPAAALALLSGCVVLPRTTQLYDPQCRAFSRHMELESVEIGAIGGCANQGCAALIIAASAVTAATAIVSGSIVVVGNIVYWIERTAQCRSPDGAS